MTSRRFRCPASRGSAARPAAPRLGLAALALASLALASCWHPAFDPDVSGSEAVIRKLGAPVLQFSEDGVRGWEMENAWFLPVAADLSTLPYDPNGLLIRPVFSSLRISSVRFEASTNTGDVDYSTSEELFNAFGNQYTFYIAPDSSRTALVASDFNRITYFSGFNPLSYTHHDPPSIYGTFGFGMVRSSNPPAEAVIAWIGYIDVANTVPGFYISLPGSHWVSGAPSFPAPTNIIFGDHGLVDTSKPGKAFLSGTTLLYLSCAMRDGSRAIYRWTNPSTQQPVRFSEVYGPLVAGLSDGRLLAEKDGILTVLDPDLRCLFSFPAGKLRFVHERWDGSRMISVFTRTLYVRTSKNDNIGRLKVEVYEIPTADLHRLAD